MKKEEVKKEIKAEPVKILAVLKSVDDEGYRIKTQFESEGVSAQEALNKLEWPHGVNLLVRVKVTKGNLEREVALAPHRVRQILEHKDYGLFERYFGSF